MEEIFGRVLLIRGEEKRENRNVCVLPFWGFLAFASCRWMFSSPKRRTSPLSQTVSFINWYSPIIIFFLNKYPPILWSTTKKKTFLLGYIYHPNLYYFYYNQLNPPQSIYNQVRSYVKWELSCKLSQRMKLFLIYPSSFKNFL